MTITREDNMSNHSSDSNNAPDAMLRKMMEQINQPLGPTGEHPRGRLTPTDEGGIRFAVGAKDGVVVIDFGKPVVWVGMPPDQARQLAASLTKQADAIDQQEQKRLENEVSKLKENKP